MVPLSLLTLAYETNFDNTTTHPDFWKVRHRSINDGGLTGAPPSKHCYGRGYDVTRPDSLALDLGRARLSL